jgi:hypothetical protein
MQGIALFLDMGSYNCRDGSVHALIVGQAPTPRWPQPQHPTEAARLPQAVHHRNQLRRTGWRALSLRRPGRAGVHDVGHGREGVTWGSGAFRSASRRPWPACHTGRGTTKIPDCPEMEGAIQRRNDRQRERLGREPMEAEIDTARNALIRQAYADMALTAVLFRDDQ